MKDRMRSQTSIKKYFETLTRRELTRSSCYRENRTYSMRWIRWHCPFGHTVPGWGEKCVPSPYNTNQINEKPQYIHEFLCKLESVWRHSSLQALLKFIPYKRHEQSAPSWIPGQQKSSISKIGEIAMKHLNISVSSCANWNLSQRNWSPESFLKSIPYKRDHLNRWSVKILKNQQNRRNCSEKPVYLHEFWNLFRRL